LFTVLVNSTDAYEDCWAAFFTLFAKFWPQCQLPVLLNTETKDFSWPELNVRAARIAGGRTEPPPWGECLLRCLDLVNTEVILYLQEDYFLHAPVDVATLDALTRKMVAERHGHISLTAHSTEKPWSPLAGEPLLCAVDQKAAFRINLQAGLWRTQVLRRHLRRHENPWQFEVWGTRRSHRVRESFLCVNPDSLRSGKVAIIPYIATGIIEGQWWKPAVIPLFEQQGIHVDFSGRGFHDVLAPKAQRRPWIGQRAWARFRSLV
jgi:hypothetical protein